MSRVRGSAVADGPLRLSVRNGVVTCPRRGRISASTCRRCRHLHGTIEDADLTILCGRLEPRPAILRPATGDEPLIFNIDWPDE